MTQIETKSLACGMPLIVENMPGVRSAGLTWLLPAGAAMDPEGLQGRAAVLEEMLMRGAGGLDSRAQADAFDRLSRPLSVPAAPRAEPAPAGELLDALAGAASMA